MLDFLALPSEILGKVTEQLEGPHKKQFRGTCRQINSIVERYIFQNIVLKYSNYQPDLLVTQLEALAKRTTNARHHARSLVIRGFSPESHLGVSSRPHSLERNHNSRSRSRGPLSDSHIVNKAILAHLSEAITSLIKVQDVWWQFGMNDSDWVKTIVMDSLTSLPCLEEIQISLGGGSALLLKLSQLKNMRKIRISGFCPEYRQDIIPGLSALISSSPRLTHLAVDSGIHLANSETSTLHDLFDALAVNAPLPLTHLDLRGWCLRLDSKTLLHLEMLESLTINSNIDTREEASIEEMEDMTKDELLQRTRDYCSANDEIWDTLRREQIYLSEVSTDEVSKALLDYLASYSGLKKLTLTFATSAKTSSSDALAIQFYHVVLLKHAYSLSVLDVSPVLEGKWCFGRHNIAIILQCRKLVSLKMSINSNDIGGRENNIIWKLLETADNLPFLSQLTISSADLDRNRSLDSNHLSMINHICQVNKKISNSVTKYGPLGVIGTPKVITTPARDYVAKLDREAGGGMWYRSSMSRASGLDL